MSARWVGVVLGGVLLIAGLVVPFDPMWLGYIAGGIGVVCIGLAFLHAEVFGPLTMRVNHFFNLTKVADREPEQLGIALLKSLPTLAATLVTAGLSVTDAWGRIHLPQAVAAPLTWFLVTAWIVHGFSAHTKKDGAETYVNGPLVRVTLKTLFLAQVVMLIWAMPLEPPREIELGPWHLAPPSDAPYFTDSVLPPDHEDPARHERFRCVIRLRPQQRNAHDYVFGIGVTPLAKKAGIRIYWADAIQPASVTAEKRGSFIPAKVSQVHGKSTSSGP